MDCTRVRSRGCCICCPATVWMVGLISLEHVTSKEQRQRTQTFPAPPNTKLTTTKHQTHSVLKTALGRTPGLFRAAIIHPSYQARLSSCPSPQQGRGIAESTRPLSGRETLIACTQQISH